MTRSPKPPPTRVLVVDDEPSARSGLSALLRDEGYDVQTAADGFKALGRIRQWKPDIVLTDVRMPALGGLELLAKLRAQAPDISIVVMSAYCSVEGAVEAMQLGADDYLSKPLVLAQVLAVLGRTVSKRALAARANDVRAAVQSLDPEADLLGQSKVFRELIELAGQVAQAPVSVLLVGERGTGKESVARLIHQRSRRPGAFVTIRCNTDDEAALDAELFAADGRLLADNDGTVLLADVDALSLEQQRKLLRFLADSPATAGVRVLASTTRDLTLAVKAGRFREDLYYRLSVVNLRLPPLRERREDISLLASHFVKRHARRLGKSITGCTERVLQALFSCDWPGNIRQLEHCIEHAVVVARGPELEPRDLPRTIIASTTDKDVAPSIPGASLWEIERHAILKTLEHTGGSTARAAKILGISTRKIQYRLCQYGGHPRPEDAPLAEAAAAEAAAE